MMLHNEQYANGSTVKILTIIRHAKSSWTKPELPDIARPLNKRGLKNAPEMGLRIRDHGILFDSIYSSTADRAIATAQLISEPLDVNKKKIIVDPSLYTQSYEELLDWVRIRGNKENNIALVGHNPAITNLINYLTLEHIKSVPTCGVATVILDVKRWEKAGAGKASLNHYDYPKKSLLP